MVDPVTGTVLGAIGFGSNGISAGSIAAGVQSAVYGGATKGLISCLTSIAMGGNGGAAGVAIVAGAKAGAAGVAAVGTAAAAAVKAGFV